MFKKHKKYRKKRKPKSTFPPFLSRLIFKKPNIILQILLTNFFILQKKKISIGEFLLKKLLDEIFLNTPYEDNYRPNFLKNIKTGKNLEIDRYYPSLKLGFEYNGLQHNMFEYQKDKDKIKLMRCKKEDITLIIIESKDLNYRKYPNMSIFYKINNVLPRFFSLKNINKNTKRAIAIYGLFCEKKYMNWRIQNQRKYKNSNMIYNYNKLQTEETESVIKRKILQLESLVKKV